MGKGGCAVVKENNSVVSALDNERDEKMKNQPKFYWAHDEEPHRRRWAQCKVVLRCCSSQFYYLTTCLYNSHHYIIGSKRFWSNTLLWSSICASINLPSTRWPSGFPSNSSRSMFCRELLGTPGSSAVTLYLDPLITWWLLQCTSYLSTLALRG